MGALVADPAGRTDVLVAPATPPGAGALAIVRLSGPSGAALAVARRVAPGLPERPEPRRVHLSRFLDADGCAVDEGLVLFFSAPRSATGEEVVELHSHGSPAIVRALVAAACRAGARPARPGEFTRRALAAGRIDLARAEAVAGLAAAASRGEARRAFGLYGGALSDAVQALRERTLDLLAELEAGLDFAEDVPLVTRAELEARIDALAAELRRLHEAPLARSESGAPAVAIVGRPNSGKSTLFNALLGEDRAIVTEHAGTTRDVLGEEIELEGERARILDTAGLREEGGPVERIGIARARAAAGEAELVLYLVDSSLGACEADRAALDSFESRALLVFTKSDLPPAGARPDGALAVSAKTGEGLAALARRIAERLGRREPSGSISLLARHREALGRALAALAEARAELPAGEEFAAAAVRRVLHALGEITGETASEELLERIFSGFCVGK